MGNDKEKEEGFTEKIKYKLDLNLDRGFRLKDKGGIEILITSLFLESDRFEDIVTLEEYMEDTKVSLEKIIEIVKKKISKINVRDDHNKLIYYGFQLLEIKKIAWLKKLLEQNKERLRGIQEDAAILCDKESPSIKLNHFIGFIPSGNRASLMPIKSSINDVGLLIFLTIKSSTSVFVFLVNFSIIFLDITITSCDRI